MNGKLYGVGIGPGDPELLTLKAVRLIRENDVIALPGACPQETVAYRIAKKAVPEIKNKQLLALPMPMTRNQRLLDESHDEAAERVESCLKRGRNVIFLSLGDPTIYSTYLYVHKRILARGYQAELVSGVPSFCAAAARLGIGLAERAEELHVIPASYEPEEVLSLPGTKILMKAGRSISSVKRMLEAAGANAMMVENCGMPGEKIYRTTAEIPDDAGYYSLIIIKEADR